MNENNEILTLSDSSIAQIAKIVQVAILTGTDITDNLRMMRLKSDNDGLLILDEDYKSMFESHIESMLSEAAVIDSSGELSEDWFYD